VALEGPKRVQHPSRWEHGDVVVSGDDQEWGAEGAEESGRGLVLVRPAAVREVTARDDEVGRDALDELGERALELRVVQSIPRAEMKVRHVEDAR